MEGERNAEPYQGEGGRRMTAIDNTTLARLAGLALGGATIESLRVREKVVAMTEAAEAAAMTPNDPGGLSHSLRAALACRAARLNGDAVLANYYYAKVTEPEDKAHSNPADPGSNNWLRAVLGFSDKVTASPRRAIETDIAALTSAGVSEPDIVRLCELIAFLAYQYRVIAGLVLMEKTA